MEFLKEILGDELFKQFQDRLNAYNGDEAHKDKLIKLVNLSDGGYVSKDKYTSLETDLAGKGAELEKANGLIEELKKSAGQDETLKGKISEYETIIAALQAENEKLKIENALKFALAQAGAVDVDYLVFKAKEKGEITLDTDGKIKGEADLISGLKTQLPTMFNTGGSYGNGGRNILENNLPNGNTDKTVTKELTGADALTNIRNKIAGYYTQVWENELMNIAKAVLGVADLSSHVLYLATDGKALEVGTVYNAEQAALGDMAGGLGLLVMHSKTYAWYLKKGMVEFEKYVTGAGAIKTEIQLPTIAGKKVLVTDYYTSEGNSIYDTYLFGEGVFLSCDKTNYENQYTTDYDPESSAGVEKFYTKQGKVLHPNGLSLAVDKIEKESPTITELGTADNWSLKFNHKNVKMGVVKHFNAKIQESTHIFLCDFTSLKGLSTKWVWNPFNFLTGIINTDEQKTVVDATSENARMVIQGLVYEILLIDNPMNMNEHLEIYLKFVGGQNGS